MLSENNSKTTSRSNSKIKENSKDYEGYVYTLYSTRLNCYLILIILIKKVFGVKDSHAEAYRKKICMPLVWDELCTIVWFKGSFQPNACRHQRKETTMRGM